MCLQITINGLMVIGSPIFFFVAAIYIEIDFSKIFNPILLAFQKIICWHFNGFKRLLKMVQYIAVTFIIGVYLSIIIWMQSDHYRIDTMAPQMFGKFCRACRTSDIQGRELVGYVEDVGH